MSAERHGDEVEGLAEQVGFDQLIEELDAILDAWFLDQVAPALEEARRARAALTA